MLSMDCWDDLAARVPDGRQRARNVHQMHDFASSRLPSGLASLGSAISP
jgi:hypothetical protein